MILSMYWTFRHAEYNDRYFDGILAALPVYLAPMDTCWGLYMDPESSIGRPEFIMLSTDLNHHQKGNILLHEMCHQATSKDAYHHHGAEWREWMRRCGFTGKITMYTGRYKQGDRT